MKKIALFLVLFALALWGNANMGRPTAHPSCSIAQSEVDTSATRSDSLPPLPVPVDEKTAYRLSLMPYLWGGYEVERLREGKTDYVYILFAGDRIYTLTQKTDTAVAMTTVQREVPRGDNTIVAMRSIDLLKSPRKIPRHLLQASAQMIDEQMIDYLVADFFTPLFRFDSLFALPEDERPDLDTLGMDDVHRQLPEVYGLANMTFEFENGQTATQSMAWQGREYGLFSTMSSQEFSRMSDDWSQYQPTRYEFAKEPKGEFQDSYKMGYTAFLNALAVIHRNLYLTRRHREVTSSQPEGFYDKMQAEVQTALDSVAKLRKLAQVKAAQKRSKKVVPQRKKKPNVAALISDEALSADVMSDERLTSPTGLSASTSEGQKSPDTPARYIGGEHEMLLFMARNIKYPPQSIADDVQGTVKIRFAVEPDGTITGVHVTRSLDEYCNLEAMSVVWSFPRLVPAFKNGRPVRSWMDLPVKFSIAN